MSRKSGISYYASRRGYYTCIDGLQNHLATGPDDAPNGPTYLAAQRKLAGLLEDQAAELNGMQNRVGVLINRYLEHVESHRSRNTRLIAEQMLAPFCREFGESPVGKLRAIHVTRFLTRMQAQGQTDSKGHFRPWNDGTVRLFLSKVQACLNWAALPVNGLIPSNPLRGYEAPAARSRGRACLIGPEVHVQLLRMARPTVRDVLIGLQDTGCRPDELLSASARDWDDAKGALIYYRRAVRRVGEGTHKTAASKERVILFTGEALAMMRRRVRQYPEGPLFRTRTGRRYNPRELERWFANHRDKIGLPDLVPYGYRHAFATAWLSAGKSVDHLAALMGNSPAVIRLHYNHLLANTAALRSELESFKSDRAANANPQASFRVVG